MRVSDTMGHIRLHPSSLEPWMKQTCTPAAGRVKSQGNEASRSRILTASRLSGRIVSWPCPGDLRPPSSFVLTPNLMQYTIALAQLPAAMQIHMHIDTIMGRSKKQKNKFPLSCTSGVLTTGNKSGIGRPRRASCKHVTLCAASQASACSLITGDRRLS